MKYAFALIAAAGLATVANAQNTRLVFEASNDGGASWAANVNANPGSNVLVRIRAVYERGTAASTPGFAGITFQPTLSGWTAADAVMPFATRLDYTAGANDLGRVAPFWSVGQEDGSASGLLRSFVDGGNTLRFGGSKLATATTNLAWGLNSSQLTQNLNPSGFNSNLDVVIFRYGITLGPATTVRTLTATAPLNLINNSRGTWYATSAGGSVQGAITQDFISNATINIVPAPASLALLGLGGLVAGRRRR